MLAFRVNLGAGSCVLEPSRPDIDQLATWQDYRLLETTVDLTGRHDTLGGCCSAQSSTVRCPGLGRPFVARFLCRWRENRNAVYLTQRIAIL